MYAFHEQEPSFPAQNDAISPNTSPEAIDAWMESRLQIIRNCVASLDSVLRAANDQQLPPYYREKAQKTLNDLHEASDTLLQSLQDRSPIECNLAGYTLRLARLRQIDRNYRIDTTR